MILEPGLERGARPASYYDFCNIAAKSFINLEEGFFEFFHGRVEEEERWCEKMDRSYIHLPQSDILPPSRRDVNVFLRAVRSQMNEGPVYFHCLYGVDRTGYMSAAYRIIIQGWSNQKAIDEMLAQGFHKFPYGFWIKSLEQMK